MPTLLPTDADNNPIPAMRLRGGGAHAIAATTGASARNANPFSSDTKVVSVFATGPVYLRFGNATVSAASTDHYFPGNTYYDFAVTGGDGKGPRNANIAALAVSGACTVYLSEKE